MGRAERVTQEHFSLLVKISFYVLASFPSPPLFKKLSKPTQYVTIGPSYTLFQWFWGVPEQGCCSFIPILDPHPESVGSVFIVIYLVNTEELGVPEVLNVQPHLLRVDKYIQYLQIYL